MHIVDIVSICMHIAVYVCICIYLGALTIQEEISQIKRKLQAGKKTQERQKKRYRDRMVER